MRKQLRLILVLLFLAGYCKAETFTVGSYIINMGVTPQTVGNGMKPYGLVYEFLKTYNIPVRWVIKTGKAKDSADFTYKGTKYKGGTFIIPKEYINTTVKSRLTYWKGQGVVMDSTTSSLTVTVTRILTSAPKWTISTVNTSIATSMFTYAGIPASSYNTNAPASLGACDDIFAMPHADPTWALHGNLYYWNRNYRGAIWANCHAISVMEGLVNPSNSAERMNFLSTQGLINYGSHADGTPSYNYFFNRGSYNGSSISASADDPVFQMMGIEDGAHTNGSEQIYIPIAGPGSGWRNTTKIGCYDSTQSNVSAFPNGPAAVTLYGRGFGLSTAGYVMYQSGHNITGTAAINISAMRQFFNFSFMAMEDKVPAIAASSIASTMSSNNTYTFSVTASSPVGASLSYQWSSYGGGVFSNATAATTSFSTNNVFSDTDCVVTCLVTDACGRSTFTAVPVQIFTALPVKLINFEVGMVDQSARISWACGSEEGVLKYEVQRSIDGETYHTISSVDAVRNNNTQNSYSYIDADIENMNQRVFYYRLRIIDVSGTAVPGPVQEIERPGGGQDIISLIPNPASQNVSIELGMPYSYYQALQISDIYGRVVLEINQPETPGEYIIKVDVGCLKKGIYFVNIRKKSGASSCIKFLKS